MDDGLVTKAPDFEDEDNDSLPSTEVVIPTDTTLESGRPTKLTKETFDIIIDRLNRGNYLVTAAAEAGITNATLHAWIRKGREFSQLNRELDPIKEQPFSDFFIATEKARAVAEVKAVDKIRQDPSWQSSAWYLERSAPQRWGRVVRQEISGPEGGAIEVDLGAVMRKLESMAAKFNLPEEGEIIEGEIVEDDIVEEEHDE